MNYVSSALYFTVKSTKLWFLSLTLHVEWQSNCQIKGDFCLVPGKWYIYGTIVLLNLWSSQVSVACSSIAYLESRTNEMPMYIFWNYKYLLQTSSV